MATGEPPKPETEKDAKDAHPGREGPSLRRLRRGRQTIDKNITLPLEVHEVLFHIANELQVQAIGKALDPSQWNASEVFRRLFMFGYVQYVEEQALRFLRHGKTIVQVMGLTRLPQARLRALALQHHVEVPPPTEQEDEAEMLRARGDALEVQLVAAKALIAKLRGSRARSGALPPDLDAD